MQHALYAPGLGYYAAGSTKFGEAGDFITAPEVSACSARSLPGSARKSSASCPVARYSSTVRAAAGWPPTCLLRCERLDALPSAYRILEVSADLRERQEVFRETTCRTWPTWLPGSIRHRERQRGVILANEVLDALPVERFVRRENAVMQLRVAAGEPGFEFIESAAPARLARFVETVEGELGGRFPDGYVSEVRLAVPDWIAGVSATLETGVALLFDYGVSRREYYAPERNRTAGCVATFGTMHTATH